MLASINKIETGFGTNLNVSTAGAQGWMQFLPSSWEAFGVDANGDGKKDPYNPVDAICAAASYLKLAGGQKNLYDAIFAYNHADWYVQEVLLYARAYGRLPSDLVGSLTGLTEGAHFPIAADARYADDISARTTLKSAKPGEYEARGNAAEVISSSPTPRGINIFAAAGAPVVAVNDGLIRKMGHSEKLGNFVVLEDNYGNRYTYATLGNLVRDKRLVVMPSGDEKRLPVESENLRPRLRALPQRAEGDGCRQGPDEQSTEAPKQTKSDGRLKVGAKVIAGTVLARVGAPEDGIDPHVNFSIRPAGKGAPRIDPKPILDGWKLLEATAIYRAKGKNPFTARLSGAGVLLLSKEALIKRVLADDGLSIYGCGQEDIASGQIDRRVLAMLEYLRSKGYKLDRHLAQMRPRLPHHLRQRLRALLRRRGRHRRDQRRAGAGPPGPGDADRRPDPRAPAPAGDDGAAPGDLARGPARPDQLPALRSCRPRPRRLPRDRRQPAGIAILAAAEAGAVAASDQPPRRDRKSGSARSSPRRSRCPTTPPRVAATAAPAPAPTRSPGDQGESRPWPSYSDSRSSISPARCSWRTAATWRVTSSRAGPRACSS